MIHNRSTNIFMS